jgi:hypothetical protein
MLQFLYALNAPNSTMRLVVLAAGEGVRIGCRAAAGAPRSMYHDPCPRADAGGEPGPMRILPLTCCLLVPLLGAVGATTSAAGQSTQPAATSASTDETTSAFLERSRGRYESALRSAGRWLLLLDVDPAALQKAGVKGKKKMAELLDALRYLEAALPAAERKPVRARIVQIHKATLDPRFHDMGAADDLVFKQNSLSYLRIAYLLDRLGLDTALYREEIGKIQPRLDRAMRGRGPHQRMAFHSYYEHFGLAEPFPLTKAFAAGLIAARPRLEAIDRKATYALTHEIFVPYEFGDKLDASFFDQADLDYLRGILPRLTRRAIEARDPDLGGELAGCMRLLRFDDDRVFPTAIDFLLGEQRPDGAWGHDEAAERRMGGLAQQALYLHTTTVVLCTLTLAYGPR